MNENATHRYAAITGFAVLSLVPSFDIVLKYARIPGIALYFVAGLTVLYLCDRVVIKRFASVSERSAMIAGVLVLLILILIAAIGYPLANSGRFGGGSDIDDAMIVGASALLRGEYPYYQLTYLGGMLSPMPGTIVLSVPFVLLGLIQYQNIFWLAILFLTTRRILSSSIFALGAILTVSLLSPTFYQVLVTGSDHITNSIYIIIGLWLTVRAVTDPRSSMLQRLLPAILLGIGLSSRSNFLLILPLFFSVLVQNAGWKDAVKYVGVALVVFAAVTLPFYLYDPAGFTPLIVQRAKVTELEALLPHAGVIIPFVALLLSCILAFGKMRRDCAAFFRNCAIVQLFTLLFTSILYAVQSGHFTLFLGSAGYGMFTLFFASLSVWISLQNARQEPVAA